MNIKDLIKELEKYPEDTECFYQFDFYNCAIDKKDIKIITKNDLMSGSIDKLRIGWGG